MVYFLFFLRPWLLQYNNNDIIITIRIVRVSLYLLLYFSLLLIMKLKNNIILSERRRRRGGGGYRFVSVRARSAVGGVGGGGDGARVCAATVTATRSAGRHECARYRSATWSWSSPASQWRSGRSSCVIFTSLRVPRNDHVSHDRVLHHASRDFYNKKYIFFYLQYYYHISILFFLRLRQHK